MYICTMAKDEFPIYRKYKSNTSYFKIESNSMFTEIQRIGNTQLTHHIEAKILPDFQRIQDMIHLHDGHWVESSEQEFNAQLKA